MSLLPFFEYAARRLLGRTSTLEEVASDVQVLEPESEQMLPRAVYIEESMRRVTAPAAFSTLEGQYEIINGGRTTHMALRAYSLRDALLFGNSVYCSGFRQQLTESPTLAVREVGDYRRLTKASLGCTYFGAMFFGHFWTDDIPIMMLGMGFGTPLRLPPPMAGHRQELLDLLGLAPTIGGAIAADELVVLDARGHTRSKAACYRTIRDRFSGAYTNPSAPFGVFLHRGVTGQPRNLENEQEAIDMLVSHGFVALNPEGMSLAQLASAMIGAQVVVGVEGSQLLHGLYTLAKGGCILAIQPPDRFGNIIKTYAECIGLKYGFVVGQATSSGFRVDTNELLTVLEMLVNAPAAPEP